MKMNRTIIMFDMDGTLTEPREPFESSELQKKIYQLTNTGIHVGIITGSDADYLREQMGDFLKKSSSRYKMHLLPCNGTKYFKPPQFANHDFKLIHEVSMEQTLTPEKYRLLLQELIYSQVDMANRGIPLTGHFINCRGSIINWCPIGRNANNEQRNLFIEMDKKHNIRERVLCELKEMLTSKNLLNKITIKLGGETSFDIYPTGWDKTYGMQHFNGWDIWFVGDRCGENGNDHEIYEACLGRSYATSGPEHTSEIIDCIIKNLRGKK